MTGNWKAGPVTASTGQYHLALHRWRKKQSPVYSNASIIYHD